MYKITEKIRLCETSLICYDNILDLSFINFDSYNLERCIDSIINEDIFHPSFIIYIKIQITNNLAFQESIRNFYKPNYITINEKINKLNLLDSLNNIHDVNHIVEFFQNKLQNIINLYIPVIPFFTSTYPK